MKCIYHFPLPFNPDAQSASGIRPIKMLQAFQGLGYEVSIVSGYAVERKKAIYKIKEEIRQGVVYDFLYSESSTMPTILTEQHHIPSHPFLDFQFFSFCKQHGIKIGVFYRDIYWKFDTYREKVKGIKYYGAIAAYQYDLWQYGRLLEKLYLPSERVYPYLSKRNLQNKLATLPPGCENIEVVGGTNSTERDFRMQPLHIFYVGGLGNQYQISYLLQAVSELSNCELTVCCRKDDWKKNEISLGHFSKCPNIHIIHEYGKGLDPYYLKADICSLLFKPDIYIEMAIPFKAFEYLAWEKPVLVSEKTAIGDFVAKNETGWVLEYSIESIKNTILQILENPLLLKEKKEQCVKAKRKNLWIKRAEKVVTDLKE